MKTKLSGRFLPSKLNADRRAVVPRRFIISSFKKDGKIIEEKVGRQFVDDMTPARAAEIRAERSRESASPGRKSKTNGTHKSKRIRKP